MPVLILGDLNGHHITWGSERCNIRGEIINEFIQETNLVVINDAVPTYCSETDGHFSAIDLSIISSQIASEFSWSVADDSYGSDHLPIIISSKTVQVNISKKPRWKLEKADWANFKETLEIG